MGEKTKKQNLWLPETVERKIQSNGGIEMHFQSLNNQEKNGAVLVTFQSPVPGYKGPKLSSSQSLKYTSAIRLLCHMLREPLFDELRTKQTLGYVVSSYYDVSCNNQNHLCRTNTTSVDSIVINVLSKTNSPPDLLRKIDEFLLTFRQTLLDMPTSEIADHTDALSKKMDKPLLNLSAERSRQFGKIRRYAPELLSTCKDLPW